MTRILAILFLLPTLNAATFLPAFPGAEGAGAKATGGRGGVVYYISNTNNTGTGSLRDAMLAGVPRIIIAKTNGFTILSTEIVLKITNSSFTLIGSKAPGAGYGVRGEDGQLGGQGGMIQTYTNGLTNFIIKDMRFMLGATNTDTVNDVIALGSVKPDSGPTNGIIANITSAFGADESVSIRNGLQITIQASMIGETLQEAARAATNGYTHALGSLLEGEVSLLRNLYYNNSARFPNIVQNQYGAMDVRNNVAWNYGNAVSILKRAGGAYPGPTNFNVVANVYIRGPALDAGDSYWKQHGYDDLLWDYYFDASTYPNTGQGYYTNNYVSYDPTEADAYTFMKFTEVPSTRSLRMYDTERDLAWATTLTPQQAYAWITNQVGPSNRSSYETRVITEIITTNSWAFDNTTSTNGWLFSIDDVGGFPDLTTADTPYTDTDSDGMQDDWEVFYFGDLSRTGDTDSDDDGYTDLEEYLYSDQYCLWLDTDLDFGGDAGDFIDMQPNRWEEWTIDEYTGPSATYGQPLSGSGSSSAGTVTIETLIIGP